MKLIRRSARKISEKLKDNHGMTLVEMTVSFVLLSIFMVSASMIISSIVNVYYQSSSVSRGLEVANILHHKIGGELENATGSDMSTDIIIGADNHSIEFTNSMGSRVMFRAENLEGKNYLTEHFFKIESSYNDDGTSKNDGYEAVDWMFDTEAYHGYVLDEIDFIRANTLDPSYEDNVIKVIIKLSSPRYGAYETEKYVKCYQLK